MELSERETATRDNRASLIGTPAEIETANSRRTRLLEWVNCRGGVVVIIIRIQSYNNIIMLHILSDVWRRNERFTLFYEDVKRLNAQSLELKQTMWNVVTGYVIYLYEYDVRRFDISMNYVLNDVYKLFLSVYYG